MPKEPKKLKDNSEESTLAPLAKALSDVDGDTSTERESEEPGNGGDGGPAPDGADEKGEAAPEGETPQEG